MTDATRYSEDANLPPAARDHDTHEPDETPEVEDGGEWFLAAPAEGETSEPFLVVPAGTIVGIDDDGCVLVETGITPAEVRLEPLVPSVALTPEGVRKAAQAFQDGFVEGLGPMRTKGPVVVPPWLAEVLREIERDVKRGGG